MAIPSIGKSQASSREHIKMHEGLRVLSRRSRYYHVLSFSDFGPFGSFSSHRRPDCIHVGDGPTS